MPSQHPTPLPEEDPVLQPEVRAKDFDQDVLRLQKFARLLDSAFPIAGNFRIGVDGIIGLIPGIGDVVGASLSTYMIIKAAQMGASTFNLIRMMANVLIEAIVGVIPFLGDLFDVAFRANERNVRLLQKQLDKEPSRANSRTRLSAAVMLLLIVFIVVLISLVLLAFKLLLMLFSGFG